MSDLSIGFDFKDSSRICAPLETYLEIVNFRQNTPKWQVLCTEFNPERHSNMLIKNIEVNDVKCKDMDEERSLPFCHVELDAPEVKRHHKDTLPRTLLCHDMANGYHSDCLVEGRALCDEYTFYNWAGIDIFCYFSHHLVTIPPVGWINVAHAHGVKVIGTVISEWAAGQAFWEFILNDSASDMLMDNLVQGLVAIAKTLKFEGWLLNIENKVSNPERLLSFVRKLYVALHAEVPHAVLIWYDSVTIDGRLNWQNALNDKNKDFFEACDGIFTNYSWSPDDVLDSAVYAGDRQRDVYIGVDVWGRNFFGGGQFNTQQAVSVVHEAGCSVAIFAPAWTFEGITDPRNESQKIFSYRSAISMSDNLTHHEKCMLRDRALWDSLWPYLNTRVPKDLPFQTSFCRGHGRRRRHNGEVVSPGPWYNLRHMQYQPNAAHGPHTYLLSTEKPIEKIEEPIITPHEEQPVRGSFTDKVTQAVTNLFSGTFHKSKASNNTSDDSRASESRITSEERNTAEPPERSEEANPSEEGKTYEENKTSEASTTYKERKTFEERKMSEERKTPEEYETSEESKTPEESKPPEEHKSSDKPKSHISFQQLKDIDPHSASEEHKLSGSSDHGLNVLAQTLSIHLKLGKPSKSLWLAHIMDEKDCLEYYEGDSFTGGSCLKINPVDEATWVYRTIRLLFCEFFCSDAMVVCLVTKKITGHEGQRLNVILSGNDSEGQRVTVALVEDVELEESTSEADIKSTTSDPEDGESNEIAKSTSISIRDKCKHLDPDEEDFLLEARALPEVPPWEPSFTLTPLDTNLDSFDKLRQHLVIHEPDFYVPVKNLFGWDVRYYMVKMSGLNVTSILCRTQSAAGPVLLGHIGLCHLTNFKYWELEMTPQQDDV